MSFHLMSSSRTLKGSKRNTRYNAYKHVQKGRYASEVHIHTKIMNCVLMRASRALTNGVPGNVSAMFTTAHGRNKRRNRSLQARKKTAYRKYIGLYELFSDFTLHKENFYLLLVVSCYTYIEWIYYILNKRKYTCCWFQKKQCALKPIDVTDGAYSYYIKLYIVLFTISVHFS